MIKVAILGSGPAGATLYRLLEDRGDTQVDIFGQKRKEACGVKSCAWGVNRSKFSELCGRLGLDPETYYTNHLKEFYLWKFKLPCDIVMIDKALFLSNLTGGSVLYEKPKLHNYDRIVDATGSNGEGGHSTYQARVGAKLPLAISIGFYPVLHCFWSFPLSSHTAHIGVLSFTNTLRGLEKKLNSYPLICQCYSCIQSRGLVKPLVESNIWKIGGRAGVVDPITGSGILASMVSAILLFETWADPEAYEKAMVRKFGYTTSKLRAFFKNEFRGLPIRLWNKK